MSAYEKIHIALMHGFLLLGVVFSVGLLVAGVWFAISSLYDCWQRRRAARWQSPDIDLEDAR